MALTKTIIKSSSTYKVEFSLPLEAAPKSKEIIVLGEFNDWNKAKAPVLKKKKNQFVGSMNVSPGSYEFRYLIDDTYWINDWAADNYVPAPFAGVENSVLHLKPIKKKAVAKKKAKKVDFTIIEGIGPKINQLILDAGITTFDALSKTKPAALKSILTAAGNRYKMHDPGTWPKQSAYVVKDDLTGLKKWQDKLKGGK